MSRITASIVLYKTSEVQLARLLDCIERSSIPVDTYLVDNSPVALDYPCFHRPSVIYTRAEQNKGYGAGHNIALRQLPDNAEFHFVLNPDIYFEPNELESMVRYMQTDSTIGQLMPKVIYPDGRLQYLCKLLPNPADLLVRRFAFGPFRKLNARYMEHFELRFTRYDQVMDVPYLSGCFMLFRTAALRQVGIFDERFFMYPEDIDMTRRMHAHFRTVFFPGASAVHDHARESYKSVQALWTHIRNMVRYFNEWGWLRDPQRSRFNRETLRRLSEKLDTEDKSRPRN
jgi:GT2 family glycosyltransferase